MSTEPRESSEAIARRAEALRQYRILDTPAEAIFDDLTLLASTICDTPMASLTFIDDECKRQWFKSTVGLEGGETALEPSFCRHDLDHEDMLVVTDAENDTRFSSNPFVTGTPGIRFYAGARLVSIEGVPIGRLCTIDRVPRELTEPQRDALNALARQVMALMEARRIAWLLHEALAEKEVAVAAVKTLQGLLPICCYCKKVRDDSAYWHTVEEYISAHAEVRFSHGICPDCKDRALRDMGLVPKEK